jgi:flagellar biosynthesis chaperone FliJ
MADTLAGLARLRRLDVAQAKRDLATAIATELAASRALRAAQAGLAQEARLSAGQLPAAFAAWLPTASAAIRQCHATERQAAAARESARQTLAAHRAALKAAETLLEKREAAARLDASRRADRMRGDRRPSSADPSAPSTEGESGPSVGT